MDIEGDLEGWLIEQVLAGRSQEDIARELRKHLREPDGSPSKLRQSTVGRSIERINQGKGLTGKVRCGIRGLFAYEAKLDARVEADQVAFLELMDALDEWQAFEKFEEKQRVDAENELRARQKKVRAHARTVIRRMQGLGIVEKGDTGFYGDGAALIREGAVDYHYHDEKAEVVGYAPPEADLAGITAAQLREGVTREQRMRPSAVPAGQPRPEMVGIRRANLIPKGPCYDGEWFWGPLHTDIAAWYELRDAAPGWWKDRRELPRSPDEDGISWYGRVLELETDLLEVGLVFEESILGWSDDWGSEEDEMRAVLQDMKRLRAGAEAGAARKKTGLKVATWIVIGVAALGLTWFVVIPVLDWLQGWIIAGGRWVGGAAVNAYDGVVRVWGGIAQATKVTGKSPLTTVVLVGIGLLILILYPVLSSFRSRTILTVLLCIIVLAIWALS